MALNTYRDLRVWQAGMEMVEAIYILTRELPSDEKYGLSAQLKGASVSVPANIAEGYSRIHRGDYLHHLSIARGSLAEVETHLILCVRLKLLSREQAQKAWKLSQKAGRMLTNQIRTLRLARSSKPQTLNPKPHPPALKAEE